MQFVLLTLVAPCLESASATFFSLVFSPFLVSFTYELRKLQHAQTRCCSRRRKTRFVGGSFRFWQTFISMLGNLRSNIRQIRMYRREETPNWRELFPFWKHGFHLFLPLRNQHCGGGWDRDMATRGDSQDALRVSVLNFIAKNTVFKLSNYQIAFVFFSEWHC